MKSTQPKSATLLSRIAAKIRLDAPLSIVGYFVVLSWGIFAVYCIWGLMFKWQEVTTILTLLNGNWVALLLLMGPGFYLAMRKLLDQAQVEQIFPPKISVRERAGPPSEPPTSPSNTQTEETDQGEEA